MLVQGNYAPLLTPGLRDIFNTTAGRPDPMRDTLYQIVPSTMASESYLGFGSRRLVQPYRGSIPYEDQDAYYETSIRNVLLVDGMAVEKVLLEDDQYGTIRQMAADFSENFATTREHDAVQPFINAFTDAGVNRLGLSTAGADAVGLCSLLHPNGPINAGTTQANEGTLALSIDNYDTTRQAMLNWTDDKGGLMASKPDVILVPTELQRTAEQIFNAKAIYEPGSAEFTVNIFAGMTRVIVWNRLTDANAWFVIDSGRMKQHLLWQDRVAPTFTELPQVNPEIAQWSGRMRYATGWKHWAWIYGQNPS